MKLLLDLEPLLWSLAEPDRLSETARNLLQDPSNPVWISSLTLYRWQEEAARLLLPFPPTTNPLWSDFLFEELPFRSMQLECVGQEDFKGLPWYEDILARQAISEGMTLITSNPELLDLPFSTIPA